MALVGNMIATAYSGNPSIVNYDMFVAVFAMLSLFYLIPTAVKPDFAFHPIIGLVLDALNVLFWLIGGIATAAYLGAHSCSDSVSNRYNQYCKASDTNTSIQSYTASNVVTNGSPDREKRCREAQASTAFLWFGFATFCVSLAFSIMSSRGGANTRSTGVRRHPTMSQV